MSWDQLLMIMLNELLIKCCFYCYFTLNSVGASCLLINSFHIKMLILMAKNRVGLEKLESRNQHNRNLCMQGFFLQEPVGNREFSK